MAAALLAFTARQTYGQDGADQMTLIVGITCAVSLGPFQSDFVIVVGACFLAGQAALAYLSAGVAKVISPVWRTGIAVGLVVNTASYGSHFAGAFLAKHAWLGRLMTWGTILFELLFVLALVGPREVTAALLVAGVGFHLGIAFVMGLNNFVPAFPSTYPAVFYVASTVGLASSTR